MKTPEEIFFFRGFFGSIKTYHHIIKQAYIKSLNLGLQIIRDSITVNK